MAHEYTPKHFLRQAPNDLLQTYFAKHGELADVPWDTLEEEDVDPIYEAWRALPMERIGQIESEFRAIFDLATEDGVRTMVTEATYIAPEAVEGLNQREGFVQKAFWLFLNEPMLFAHVTRCDWADHLSARSWKTRKGLPCTEPDTGEEACTRLADAVSAFYREKEGRGEHCRAEAFVRGDGRTYVFVYPQDYADTFIGYDEDGTFVRVAQQPAFEIVYAFDAEHGVLEMYAKGSKRLKQRLEEFFIECLLAEEPDAEPPDNHAYNLDLLKDPEFPMPTDPQDNIRDIRVKTLRLYLPDHDGQIVIDSSARAESSQELYRIMDAYLVDRQVSRESVRVGGATIQMQFGPDGNRCRKPYRFNLSARTTRNLNRDRPEEQLARKYLRQWGISNA
jgi:hypothetical protein